jgi:hypothetical protein
MDDKMRRRNVLALWVLIFWIVFTALVFVGRRIATMPPASPQDLAYRISGTLLNYCFLIGAVLAVLLTAWLSKTGVLPGTRKKDKTDPITKDAK